MGMGFVGRDGIPEAMVTAGHREISTALSMVTDCARAVLGLPAAH
ncbi:MAG: hypothetical protein ACR2P2_17140 [Nakamurella sp.]